MFDTEASVPPSHRNAHTANDPLTGVQRSPTSVTGKRDDLGWGWLALMLPLCCVLPLLLGGIAAAGASVLGPVIGVPVAVIAVTAGIIWMRRRRAAAACCPPATVGRPQ